MRILSIVQAESGEGGGRWFDPNWDHKYKLDRRDHPGLLAGMVVYQSRYSDLKNLMV